MSTSEDEDVPPLEDLTEEVLRAKARRAPVNEPRMRSDAREAACAEKGGVSGGHGGSPEAGRDEKTFGGFSKGFLLSSPTSSQQRKKPSSTRAAKEKPDPLPSHTRREGGPTSPQRGPGRDDRTDSDIPFLRQRDVQDKGPVFPEVQEAMKEAYPLLNTEEWMTESLLEKIEKHPLLSKALRDPNLSRVLSQFHSDPRSVLQAAAGNPEMQTFLKEFCSLMGSHFTELANKHDPKPSPAEADATELGMDKDVQRALGEKGVKEALLDPDIQRLIGFLKDDSRKAQKMLSSASPGLQQKIQLLVDKGILAMQ